MQKVAMQEAESDRIKRFGYAHFAAKMHPNFMENHAKTSQNPFKIDQNDAQERSESDLGSSSVSGPHAVVRDKPFFDGFLC